jgi:cbb3-type cytochrome oxidase maturation protein
VDILYLLIPLSAALVLGILGVFAWALHAGQFDDLEQHGARILEPEETASEETAVDAHQAPSPARTQESPCP